MEKRGHCRRNWKTRFFIIDGKNRRMVYYPDEGHVLALGECVISRIEACDLYHPAGLELISQGGKVYYLKPSGEAVKEQLVALLNWWRDAQRRQEFAGERREVRRLKRRLRDLEQERLALRNIAAAQSDSEGAFAGTLRLLEADIRGAARELATLVATERGGGAAAAEDEEAAGGRRKQAAAAAATTTATATATGGGGKHGRGGRGRGGGGSGGSGSSSDDDGDGAGSSDEDLGNSDWYGGGHGRLHHGNHVRTTFPAAAPEAVEAEAATLVLGEAAAVAAAAAAIVQAMVRGQQTRDHVARELRLGKSTISGRRGSSLHAERAEESTAAGHRRTTATRDVKI
jgi:hypothetical protein